jgi:hypothetical protein
MGIEPLSAYEIAVRVSAFAIFTQLTKKNGLRCSCSSISRFHAVGHVPAEENCRLFYRVYWNGEKIARLQWQKF